MYTKVESDGLTVYVAPNIKASQNRITLSVKRALFFGKMADVRGVMLNL